MPWCSWRRSAGSRAGASITPISLDWPLPDPFAIAFEKISQTFGGYSAVDGIDLEISAAELSSFKPDPPQPLDHLLA